MRSPITRANRRLPSRRFAPSINAIIVGREDPTRASPSAKPTNMCIYSGFVTYNFVKLAKTRLLLKRRKNIAPEYRLCIRANYTWLPSWNDSSEL